MEGTAELWWMDLEPYPGLDFLIEELQDWLDLPEGMRVKVYDRNWRDHLVSQTYSWQGQKVGYVREVEHFIQTGDYLITVEVKHFPQTGLPWSHPNSDPVGDLRNAINAGRVH